MRAHRQSWLCRAGVFHGERIPRSYPAGGAANTLLTGTAWQGLGSCRFDTRAPGAIPCEHPVLPKNYVCCDSGLSLSHTASLSPWVHLLWRKNFCKAQIHAFKENHDSENISNTWERKNPQTAYFPDFRKLCVVEMVFFLSI